MIETWISCPKCKGKNVTAILTNPNDGSDNDEYYVYTCPDCGKEWEDYSWLGECGK